LDGSDNSITLQYLNDRFKAGFNKEDKRFIREYFDLIFDVKTLMINLNYLSTIDFEEDLDDRMRVFTVLLIGKNKKFERMMQENKESIYNIYETFYDTITSRLMATALPDGDFTMMKTMVNRDM
ncbi:MAG: hypothetical protein GY940_07550, partial [bacterium]|nr:hypothetical protein [bacterium]